MLVAGEVALALMLMAGAGLLIRSALLVSHLDPGFDTANLIVGRVGLPDIGYHDPAVARQTFERMITAAEALPGVQSAAVVSRAPLAGGGSSNGLIPEGKALDLANVINSQLQIVSAGYLSTARIPLKAGREFTAQDTRDKALVTIVNETLARTAWPHENPIGKRFACCEAGPKGRMDPVWHEVVGVVGDVRAWGLDRQIQPEFYLPMAQMPPAAWDWIGRTMDLMVRTRDGRFPASELRTTVASIAPGVPIYRALDRTAEDFRHAGRIALRYVPAGRIRGDRAVAVIGGNLWSPLLRGGAAHAPHRHPHGAGRHAGTGHARCALVRPPVDRCGIGAGTCRRRSGHARALLVALWRQAHLIP